MMRQWTRRLNQTLSILILVTILANLIWMPEVALAQSPAGLPAPQAAVVAGGERFMTAAPEAMGNALQLAQLLEYMRTTDPKQLQESTVAQARGHALATAENAAIAQGAIGAITGGLEEAGVQIQLAADMDALVGDLDANGFPAAMDTLLLDMGLSITQVVELRDTTVSNFNRRRNISQSGFLSPTVTRLLDAGYTTAQIDAAAARLGTFGLAASHTDKLEQFRAAREEMSLVRDEALIVAMQLLSRQVFLRAQNGQSGRPLSEAEVETLLADELRLLTHIGYLNSLQDQRAGEGQWLFVERYSRQAAGRLESLILDSHNVGLVVDLFVVRQILAVSLAAGAGSPTYAMAEIDTLGQALASLVGEAQPANALHSTPPLGYRLALLFHQWTGYRFLGEGQTVQTAVDEGALRQARRHFGRRAARLAALPPQAGAIEELDETNNTDWLHFFSAPPNDLPPGLLSILEDVIPNLEQVLDFVWGVLTGQSDNPIAIGANIVLSFVPVLGEALDLIAIFVEPTTWGKAMALIGLLASLLSDGAEILATIGAAIPPTLAATVPGAILLEAIDIGAAILKPINRFVNAQIADLISRIPFDRVLRLGGDLLGRLARNTVDAIGGASHWPSSIDTAIRFVSDAVSSALDPFTALLRRFGSNLDRLYRMGFGDGGYPVGRILDLSDEAVAYSDEALEGIARMGDDLAENAIDLSDEAAEGLGEAADTLGEQGTRQVFAECFLGAVSDLGSKGQKFARSARLAGTRLASRLFFATPALCDDALVVFGELGQDAQRGVAKLQTAGVDAENLLLKYADEALPYTALDDLLSVVEESAFTGWRQSQVDILEEIFLAAPAHGLSRDAIKYLPINSLDDARYPNFADFLQDSAGGGYLSDPSRVASINDVAAQGNRQAIQGHMSNVMGEYREIRYQELTASQGHSSIFQHTGPVNEPGLDAFTRKNNTYYMGEVKDRGSGAGLTIDGPKPPQNNLTPPDFQNYMTDAGGDYVFNQQYLEDTLNGWVNDPNISFSQSDMNQVLQAARTGNLEINIFAGGRLDPFGPSLRTAVQNGLRNPYTANGRPRIIVNLIAN